MHQLLSRVQLVYLLLWTVMGTGIVTLPSAIAHFTIHDAWFVPGMFLLGALLAAGVCALFLRAFPGQTLIEALEDLFGPWVSRGLSLWVVIFMYISLSMILKELSFFLEVNIFPSTPAYVLTAVAVVPLAYAMLVGIGAVGRLAEFITPVALTMGILIVILSLRNMDISQLSPVLAEGIRPVYRGGILPATSFAFQLLLPLHLVKSFKYPDKISRDILVAAAVMSVLGVFIMVAVIGVQGQAVAYQYFPILEVIRSIRIGEFLERFDTVYAMGVIVTILIKLSVWEYVWLQWIRHLIRLPDHRSIAIAATSAVWAGNVCLFHDAQELGDYIIFVTPGYFTVTLLLLPLVALIVKRIKGVVPSSGASGG